MTDRAPPTQAATARKGPSRPTVRAGLGKGGKGPAHIFARPDGHSVGDGRRPRAAARITRVALIGLGQVWDSARGQVGSTQTAVSATAPAGKGERVERMAFTSRLQTSGGVCEGWGGERERGFGVVCRSDGQRRGDEAPAAEPGPRQEQGQPSSASFSPDIRRATNGQDAAFRPTTRGLP